jgi:hypothetical protein
MLGFSTSHGSSVRSIVETLHHHVGEDIFSPIYAIASSKLEQAAGVAGVDVQRTHLEAYFASNDLWDPTMYQDEGISGAIPFSRDREERHYLIGSLRGKFDT